MKNIYEVFDEVEKAQNRDQKKEVLLRNDSITLRNVIQGAMHPFIKYVIKEPVYYKPMRDGVAGVAYQNMHHALEKLYIWVEGSKKVNPTLSYERKLKLFIQQLESMEPYEAEVLMNMVLKDLKVKGLSYKLAAETFPGLLPTDDYGNKPNIENIT